MSDNLAEIAEFNDEERLALALARSSMRHYLEIVRVDSLPEPRPLGEIIQPWQWHDVFDPIIPAVEWLIRSEDERRLLTPYAGPQGFWITKPRGHDKTSSIARTANYCLFAGRREVPLRISVAAADTKQAKLVRDAMLTEANLNPWFGKLLVFNNFNVTGPGGKLEILSADAASSFGESPDIIICDELTHWANNKLWVAVNSGSMKRLHNVTVVITNAGYYGTWQRSVFEEKKKEVASGRWYVCDRPGRDATWMSDDKVAEVRRDIVAATGSPFEATRLLDNIWVTSRMGAVFAPEDVEAMFTGEAPPWITLAA